MSVARKGRYPFHTPPRSQIGVPCVSRPMMASLQHVPSCPVPALTWDCENTTLHCVTQAFFGHGLPFIEHCPMR
eukprot:725067-Amphidinium_carterae.1